MSIPLFILNSDFTGPTVHKSESTLQNIEYQQSNSWVNNLKKGLSWAIEHDEDIIFFSFDEQFDYEIDSQMLKEVILQAATKKIYFLYLDVETEDRVSIDKCFSLIHVLKEVKSFIILRPLYNYVFDILDCQNLDHVDPILIFKLICPFNFVVNNKPLPLTLPEHKIHILSPFRNAEKYIQNCLDSLLMQNYSNFQLYFLDDNSTDCGSQLIPVHDKIILKYNDKRKFALENILTALLENTFEEDDIICIVDGDDRLPHAGVFEIVNAFYHRYDCLLTYGSLTHFNKIHKHGGTYIRTDFDNIRKAPWHYYPLRTFKYKVFKNFLEQDPEFKQLRSPEDGTFIHMPYDMGIFFNLLEIVGYEKIQFIDTPLYEYRGHDNNDANKNRDLQMWGEKTFRNKRPLKMIDFEK